MAGATRDAAPGRADHRHVRRGRTVFLSAICLVPIVVAILVPGGAAILPLAIAGSLAMLILGVAFPFFVGRAAINKLTRRNR
jgi:hypothetical protein